MAGLLLGTTYNNSASGTTYETSSFTPAADDYLIACIHSHQEIPSAVNGDGEAWVSTGEVQSGPSHYLSVWVCPLPANGTSTTVKADFSATADGVTIVVLRVSGITRQGLDAIADYAEAAGSGGTTPSTDWGSACATTSVLVGAVANATNPCGVTPPSGWGEYADTGFDSRSGMEVAGDDTVSSQQVATWGTSASSWGAIAIVVDTTPPPASGTMSSTLGSATQAASGSETIQGSASSALGDATQAASGSTTDPPTGAMASTLGSATQDAAGDVTDPPSGAMASTLGDVVQDAAGEEEIQGAAASTLGDATQSASGDVATHGEMGSTLGDVVQDAVGDVVDPPSGTMASTLGDVVQAASGGETIQGPMASTLGPVLTASRAGAIPIQNDGGYDLTFEGVFDPNAPALVEFIGPQGAADAYPCYSAKMGEGYRPFPRSPTLVSVASPPVPLGTYDVRITQGLSVLTLANAVTVYPRNLRSLLYDLRTRYSPRMAVGARQAEYEPLVAPTPPTIAPIGEQLFQQGVPFLFTPTVENNSGYALVFAMQGTLPPGLTLAPTTGAISGTPGASGDVLGLQIQITYALGTVFSTFFDMVAV